MPISFVCADQLAALHAERQCSQSSVTDRTEQSQSAGTTTAAAAAAAAAVVTTSAASSWLSCDDADDTVDDEWPSQLRWRQADDSILHSLVPPAAQMRRATTANTRWRHRPSSSSSCRLRRLSSDSSRLRGVVFRRRRCRPPSSQS